MSKYIVSARKYRPQRFDEVVGQRHVTQTLKNSFKNEQLAHAFLFCGPRGVGKTTCARILARILNCQNVTDEQEPCNSCASCSSFDQSFNIIELDAASNNSVEHIRNLTDQVRFPPQQGKYKVFIIDEVHMLSQSAFNAFLKTLEEPPPYAVFILATTEKHKIIPTILSRCQVYDFRRIEHDELVRHLSGIASQENISVEEEGLHVIANKSDGALRDALSIFDRIASFGNKQLSYADVAETLNVLDYEYYFKAIDAMIAEDVPAILNLLDKVLSNGFEADDFILGLADHVRDLLVCKFPETHILLEGSDVVKEKMIHQAKMVSTPYMYAVLHLANDFDVQYKLAKNKRLHAEIALIKMAQAGNLQMRNPNQISQSNETISVEETPKKEDDERPRPEQQSQAPKNETPTSGGSDISKETANTATASANIPDNQSSKPSVLSLDSLDLAVKKDTAQEERPKISGDLQNDHLMRVWKTYCANVESPAVRNILKIAEIQLTKVEIEVKVGSPMAKSMILQETDLMVAIRKELNDDNLILNVIIDPEKIQNGVEPVKKPMTTKQKYNFLIQKNPQIRSLKERFDLKVDHEL